MVPKCNPKQCSIPWLIKKCITCKKIMYLTWLISSTFKIKIVPKFSLKTVPKCATAVLTFSPKAVPKFNPKRVPNSVLKQSLN